MYQQVRDKLLKKYSGNWIAFYADRGVVVSSSTYDTILQAVADKRIDGTATIVKVCCCEYNNIIILSILQVGSESDCFRPQAYAVAMCRCDSRGGPTAKAQYVHLPFSLFNLLHRLPDETETKLIVEGIVSN